MPKIKVEYSWVQRVEFWIEAPSLIEAQKIARKKYPFSPTKALEFPGAKMSVGSFSTSFGLPKELEWFKPAPK